MPSSLIVTLILALLATALAQPNPERGDLRLVVLGDFNGAYGATSYPAQLALVLSSITGVWRPDLALSAGDVIAGQNADLPDARFAEMWRAFDAEVALPLREAGVPLATAIGNHDGSSLLMADGSFAFRRERDAARIYWTQHLPGLNYLERADFPFHYSFLAKEVFVAVWDASSATIGAEGLAWLSGQLSSPAARGARYRVLVGHLPLYGVSADKNRPGEVLEDGDELRRRLERLGLDLYLSGHHAAYYPGKAGNLVLLSSGGIGARRLLNSEAAPVSTVTMLDFFFEPLELRLSTFDADTLGEIPLASLPERLDGLNGSLTRLDLAP